jgi:hypothetical protein
MVALRRERRKAERKWRQYKDQATRDSYVSVRRNVVKTAEEIKTKYYQKEISNCNGNQRKLWHTMNSLLGNYSSPVLPSFENSVDLANVFSDFFETKICRIRQTLDSIILHDDFSVQFSDSFNIQGVSQFAFHTISDDELLSYIRKSKKTYCQLDPVNFSKGLIFLELYAPILKIVNRC